MRTKTVLSLALAVIIMVSVPAPRPDAASAQQDSCGDPATPIHVIQGSGERTPVGNETHTIEGVVVGDFQNASTQLDGFYVQEEDAEADDDPLTSEGIFVANALPPVDVNAGDVVRVTGTASEQNDSGTFSTRLRRVQSVVVCSSGATMTPIEIMLPLDNAQDWERYEGMLVTFPQELTINEVYNLGRYGELTLSAGGRLYQPTNIARPGPDADDVAEDDARRLFLLDDGNNQQNAEPTLFPPGGLSAENTIRAGDTVSPGLTGVLDHRFGYYRIEPTLMPEFAASNPRPASPPDVGGRLRVASFNVLNYFNGDGLGGGFPTERGANTPEEFTRQRDKIISAILALDADVIGLMEIENDGSGPESAAADLVNGLNEAAGETLYAYIADPVGLKSPADGGDAIKQAIIYRPAAATPVGDALTTLDPPFDEYRPPVGQLFEENDSGEQFMVVVNHLKSKGCEGAGAADDEDEGQGCWNQVRTLSAQTLGVWLASDPSGTGDPDVLLIGDLNAYAMEDPLMVLADAGLTNLVVQFEGAENYSYVFDGRAGSLDHALASESLVGQVSGVATWHINADEPRVLDYNVEFKSENHVESLYDPSPFRSSDHDPVLIGLELGGPLVEPTVVPTAEPTAASTEEPTVEPTGEPTVEPTPVPTEEPADEDDSSDSSGGTVAIIAGLVAVVVAMLAGLIGLRRRAR